MKYKLFTSIAVMLLLLLKFNISIAQNVSGDSTIAATTENKFTVSAAATYSPILNYYGRTDSLKSSAVIPSLIFGIGKHFSIMPSVIFVANKQHSLNYAAATINATYTFGQQQSGVGGTIYGDKFFYKSDSKLVQAVQEGQAGFTLGYFNNILNITGGGSAAFTKDNTDFFATATLDHKFKIEKDENVFLIIPAATANAGTQHFSNSYYKKNTFLLFPTTAQLVTESSKKFGLLSYDVNLSLIYARNRFIVDVTPGYVIPQNIIAASEKGSNLFYCNATVIYKIIK